MCLITCLKIAKVPRGRTRVCSLNGLIYIVDRACVRLTVPKFNCHYVCVRLTILIRDRPRVFVQLSPPPTHLVCHNFSMITVHFPLETIPENQDGENEEDGESEEDGETKEWTKKRSAT